MKRLGLVSVFVMTCIVGVCQKMLGYHAIKTDPRGNILPWYNDDPALAYDRIVTLTWNFWDTMRMDLNGLPYYMNHQVWRPDFNDSRGLGGDQIQMAMSAWTLLYQYSGNERVKENTKFLADYYLSHGLSPANCPWPNLPFPYNTLIYSGQYDGDMVIGQGYLQPDKAGSFGLELLHLYKSVSTDYFSNATEARYLDAAIGIANSLAAHVQAGDENNSPLPFKVNAFTGQIGKLKSNQGDNTESGQSSYTTNWSSTLQLFDELIRLNKGDVLQYQKSFDVMLRWMMSYPMKSNKWGPFFEDVQGWSDTQINAMTWARFIMTHRDRFPKWKEDVQKIIDWVYATLGNDDWKAYGVTVVNEQTAYKVPGNSHTARQAADELLFAELTGDQKRQEHAIRQLNWATYMVDSDGKNRYPRDENWLTDGYGDYIRHYLRAMASLPALCTPESDHLLSSTSVIRQASYHGNINKFILPVVPHADVDKVALFYNTFDDRGKETIRMSKKPASVMLNGKVLAENPAASGEGYTWTPLKKGGILIIERLKGNKVTIYR